MESNSMESHSMESKLCRGDFKLRGGACPTLELGRQRHRFQQNRQDIGKAPNPKGVGKDGANGNVINQSYSTS